LRKIDPDIPLPTETVVEVVHRVMAGSLSMERPQIGTRRPKFRDRDLVRETYYRRRAENRADKT
jgi:hypothetical protein